MSEISGMGGMSEMSGRNEMKLDIFFDHPEKIGREVGFRDLTPMHGMWIKKMVFGGGDYTLQAHRGSYKSSCLAVAIAILLVYYPDRNIIFLRKTDNDVSEMLGMVSKILRNGAFRDLVREMHGADLAVEGESQNHLSTNLWRSPMGAPQLLGLGIRASITGKHAYYVITDDICNKDDRESRAERERTKRQYDELQNIRNKGGRIINLGTPWHKEDVFSKVHHSRVLRFIGRELPRLETIRENYWGASELEHIWDELQKRSAASANIAQLIFQANVTTLKMGDFGGNLAAGSERMKENLFHLMMNENRLRTSYGVQVMSADDSMETHSYSFAGLSDIYEAFMMDMAGAAEIPATKLFGRSPQGFNSTGESDLRNYYDMIAQSQERVLRPALEKLVPVMAISCWGYIPDDLDIVFEPVMTTSPAERAELVQKLSGDVIEAYKTGLLTREQALEELKSRGEELGVYTKV